jgi:hypothetical protein
MSGIDLHEGRAQGSQLATLGEGRTLSVDGLRAMYFMCKGLYLFNNTYLQGCGKDPYGEGCAHEAHMTHTFTTISVRVMRYMFEGPIKFGVRGKPSPQFQVHPSLLQREKLEVNIPPAPDWPNT